MTTTSPVRPGRALLVGLAAGAAGTTALNVVTYLDVVVRARGVSSTPEDTAAKLADKLGIDIPGDEDEAWSWPPARLVTTVTPVASEPTASPASDR